MGFIMNLYVIASQLVPFCVFAYLLWPTHPVIVLVGVVALLLSWVISIAADSKKVVS